VRGVSPTLALLHSPLLGPALWGPVAELLQTRGFDVLAVPRPAVAPRTPAEVLDWLLRCLPPQHSYLLIPHSNAGLYVPLLAQERDVEGFVFADAILPPPAGLVPVAPPSLLEHLGALADPQGVLPPWTRWWDDADLAPLFPGPAVRAGVEREQHRLPLSYFQQSVAVPAGWSQRPGAYLGFGDTYREEREDAATRGWPVSRLDGEHLHPLVAPSAVADEIQALIHRLRPDVA
jgi:hypothetical protein